MSFASSLYTPAQVTEAQTKIAQLEIFAKVASDNGVDLTTMSPEQVNALFTQVMTKSASDEDKKKDEPKKDDDKKEDEKPPFPSFDAAKKEHEEKKEAQAKLAESQFTGQVMGEAFLKTIQPALDLLTKAAAANGGASAANETAAPTGARLQAKEASAFDLHAGRAAVKLAADEGFDAAEAAERIGSVLTLGAPESTKIASVQDANAAMQVRALELLEIAGYPVNWE